MKAQKSRNKRNAAADVLVELATPIPVRADRTTQDGTGMAQKKSRTTLLNNDGS
jgi:hypothetical protein